MIEKIKTWSPVACLVLIACLITFWAVKITLQVEQDKTNIQQIVTFIQNIQNTQKVGQTNQQTQ